MLLVGTTWYLLILLTAFPRRLDAITTDGRRIGGPGSSVSERCQSRIEATLESLRKMNKNRNQNRLAVQRPHMAVVDLNGYALHQALRSRPFEMYVTGMRIRIPGKSRWYRVQECAYDPVHDNLNVRMMFYDLTVAGQLQLYDESVLLRNPVNPFPQDSCNITMRLHKAGLGILTANNQSPQKTSEFQLRMDSEFIEPEFISVYTYGCETLLVQPKTDDNEPTVEERQHVHFTQEIEEAFVKGIQSLLKTYLEKQLRPVMKEIYMISKGFTVSYG